MYINTKEQKSANTLVNVLKFVIDYIFNYTMSKLRKILGVIKLVW